MGPCKTFFAIAKAYCAIGILIMPRSFVNGGYIISPLALFTACFFESLCAARLASVAHSQGIYSYSLLMRKAVGDKGLIVSRIFLAIAHWQFTVGQMTFTLSSLQSTIQSWLPADHQVVPLWVYGLFIWFLYSPLMWVRTLEYFSKGFIIAVFLILLGVATTSYFALDLIEAQDGSAGPGYVAVNSEQYWSMIGFAFYMFEGIGCLLPIMRET